MIPGVGIPSLPLNPLSPNSIITYIAPAIQLMQFIIELLEQIISTNGVSIPGVGGTSFSVGTDVLRIFLNTISSLLESGRVNIPAIP